MNSKLISILLFFALAPILCFGQIEVPYCPEDIYIKIDSISGAYNPAFPTEPSWIKGNPEGCTYDEPLFESDDSGRWLTSGNYSISKLTKFQNYHDGSFADEFFWIVGGFAGRYFCVDDGRQTDLTSDGMLMEFKNINVCWPGNGLWFNFCTQCEDCNNTAPGSGIPRGRWWKYERIFAANELDIYNTTSNPLPVVVSYVQLVPCVFETDYGCGPGEEDGQE